MSLPVVHLPKWPAFVVVGDPITKDQAAEIIVRTDSFYFSANDKEWGEELCRTAGIQWSEFHPEWDSISAARKRYGNISLSYLCNHRLISAYIGGPHGWCDWNGNIGCNSFNIGKYPSVEEVFDDWVLIAETFPFLNLRSQLFSGEQVDSDIYPLIQFDVKDGLVECYIPTTSIQFPAKSDQEMFGAMAAIALCMPGRERGCTIEQFKHGLELAEKAVGAQACQD